MREIKFRAWDVKREYYFCPESMDYVLKSEGLAWVHDGSMRVADVILEQYTGLKDKNGNEIYEGDIIKSNGFLLSKVNYDEEYAQFRAWDISFADAECTYPDNEWEIIGNIHENPELIK